MLDLKLTEAAGNAFALKLRQHNARLAMADQILPPGLAAAITDVDVGGVNLFTIPTATVGTARFSALDGHSIDLRRVRPDTCAVTTLDSSGQDTREDDKSLLGLAAGNMVKTILVEWCVRHTPISATSAFVTAIEKWEKAQAPAPVADQETPADIINANASTVRGLFRVGYTIPAWNMRG
jgi:hypothetical protein